MEYGAGLGPTNDPLLREGDHVTWHRAQLAKHGHAISPGGAGHLRIEIGDVDAGPEFGRLMVSVTQSADVIHIHGLPVHLSEIRRDLRDALVASAAGYAKAQSDQSQLEQKAIIGAVMLAVLNEHPTIGARVKERKAHERYD